jgi:hypothetical protein
MRPSHGDALTSWREWTRRAVDHRIGSSKRARKHRAWLRTTPSAERLEDRALLTAGAITGVVWNDLNSSGVRDAGENGLAGTQVFLDLNRNGRYDSGAPVTTTLDAADYANGTQLTREVPGLTLGAITSNGAPWDSVKASGGHLAHRIAYGTEATFWGGSFPTLVASFDQPADFFSVDMTAYTVTSGTRAWVRAYNTTGATLAEYTSDVLSSTPTRITISGTGIDHVLVSAVNGYALISGLSFNTPIAEPTATTDANGAYSFDLITGNYIVRPVVPNGWIQTSVGNEEYVYYATGYDGNRNNALALLKIHAGTGQVTWIGNPLPFALNGLVRTNDGRLFATSWQSDHLYEIDLTINQVIDRGAIGYDIVAGLAYDPRTDILYTLGKPTANDTVNQLLIINRASAFGTAVGPGIAGLTGTSGLAMDTANNRIVAFDDADGEFYEYQLDGTARLLSLGPNVRTWGFSQGPNGFVMQLHGTGDGFLRGIFPDNGTPDFNYNLALSEPVRIESLDWNYDPYGTVITYFRTPITNVNFGIVVPNWAPVANTGGPYTIHEGDALDLDGSASSDLNNDPLTYEWDLNNDGTVEATGATPSLTWAQLVAAGISDNGSVTIGLRVSDGPNSSFTTTTLTVLNTAPSVTVTLDSSTITENSTASVQVTFTDPSPLDTFSALIAWGDGSTTTVMAGAGATSVNASHLYDDVSAGAPLQYSITATVTDDGGGQGSDQKMLNITRSVPDVLEVRYGYGTDHWVTAADLAGRAAPWRITAIAITFSRDVAVGINDLAVTGIRSGSYAFSAFTYDVATHTAVWTLSVAVDQDRLTLSLDGDDASGDMNDGVRSSAGYLASGDRSFGLDVLFGDVNGDGRVNLLDTLLLRSRSGTSDMWADLDGSGAVNLLDTLLLRSRSGMTLP